VVEVVPGKPVGVTRPARPAEPSRATPPRKKSADYNLSREIKELRKELKELRKLLNELRRDKKDRE
jgi:hypothetical protein